MKILVVNAFPQAPHRASPDLVLIRYIQSSAGKGRGEELLALVKGSIDNDAIFVDTCTHRYEDISRYIFQQPKVL